LQVKDQTKQKRIQKRRATNKALIKRLLGEDVKKAVAAAKMLAQRGSAIPSLLKLLDSQGEKSNVRVMTVLSQQNWKKIDSEAKSKVVEAVHPFLFRFSPIGRSPESWLAELIILRIGNESMPKLTSMLNSKLELFRQVGLSVLDKVKWNDISLHLALRVQKALKKIMKKNEIKERWLAWKIWKKIRERHLWAQEGSVSGVLCSVSGVLCPEQNRKPATQNRQLATHLGGENNERKAA
jgi:hypothetical protein